MNSLIDSLDVYYNSYLLTAIYAVVNSFPNASVNTSFYSKLSITSSNFYGNRLIPLAFLSSSGII